MRYSLALLTFLPCFTYGIQTPTCLSGFSWAFNSLNQSPCQIASELGGICIGTPLQLPTLSEDQTYLGPAPTNANACECSSVFYSVLSACAVCQGKGVKNWHFYSQNCTNVSVAVFPPPLPSGIAVPHYAYQNITAGGGTAFNPLIAQNDSGPESTAIPQPTGGTTGGVLINTSKSKTNAGAIAGGVVGGVVGIALIAGGLVIFRRRRRTHKPMGPFHDSSNQYSEKQLVGNTVTTGSPTPMLAKFYDPNDPSTYPGASQPFSIPSIYSSQVTATSNQQFSLHGSTANAHIIGQAGYPGTAEVMQ